MKRSPATSECKMTSTKTQGMLGTWNPLLTMKMGVAETAPGKDPPNSYPEYISVNMGPRIGTWMGRTLGEMGEQFHEESFLHQPGVLLELYCSTTLIEGVKGLSCTPGHISRLKSDYTRTEKTASIISEGFSCREQHPAILPFWVIKQFGMRRKKPSEIMPLQT